MAGNAFPGLEHAKHTDANKEDIWDESKLKLIEYSLRTVHHDTMNIRNDKYMRKEADDGGFGASADGFVASTPDEDIIGSGSEDEKFVIKGGLKTGDSLTRIANCTSDANVDCDSASDNLESSKLFNWNKSKSDALGNAWDSTVNFLKHPWTSMHKDSNPSIDEKIESNEVVPDEVNLTKNKTSSAWENTTNFVPVIANTGKTIKTISYRDFIVNYPALTKVIDILNL